MAIRPSRSRSTLALVAALTLVSLCLDLPAGAQEGPAGHWEGAIQLPTGELVVRVDLEQADDGWQGTIDIPQQGAAAVPLVEVSVEGDRVRFTIPGAPGKPTFDGTLADGEIRGTFTQGMAALPFRLGREAATLEPPVRPQEPREPYPYEAEEITLASGEVTLAGTLTLPAGEGPFPAVLLLTGSGAQDRDQALAGHRPFLVLADHLTRAGIAVLRLDDRGIGGSGGTTAEATLEIFAADAAAAVAWLGKRPRIAGDRIGLVGHSEGGLVAPLVAERSPVAFVILLAAPAVPGSEILLRQNALLLRAAGASKERVAEQVEQVGEMIELVTNEGDREALASGLRRVIERQLASAEGTDELPAETREEIIEQGVAQTMTPWFYSFVTHDPRPVLTRLRVPVLALNGSLDLQVDAEQNLPAILAALAEAGNTDVTVRRLPGLNHLLQSATTGLPAEYAQIEETLSPAVLEIVAHWIGERWIGERLGSGGASTEPGR